MCRRGYHLAGMDQAFAALVSDLETRGLLESTLVCFITEFGRTPGTQGSDGRDHHIYGFSVWMAGGGSRGHDRLGEYEVKATNSAHPIMKGVPASFRITDELYYYTPDPAGTPIEVLATATSTLKPGTYPQVFVVKHAKARIAGLTLGHDERVHDLPAYKTLLTNAVKWAGTK